MNDDELRDHLRSTLEPVSSPTPELTRLRRVARHRRQRRQFTAGGLGLLLIAGAGFGIAEATNSGSGRATLTTAPSPSTAPADVSVPCQTAQISLQLGQTLRVAPCPEPGAKSVGAVIATGDALTQVATQTFRADRGGTATLQIEFTGACNAPAGVACTAEQRNFGTISVTVGAPSPPNVSDVVTAPCKGGRVTVPVGDALTLTDCPVGVSSHVDDPTVLAAGSKPGTFTAKMAGTTNVDLFVKPKCSPGMLCPRYVRDLGTLVVTVASSTPKPSASAPQSTAPKSLVPAPQSMARETSPSYDLGDPSSWKVDIAGYGPLKIGMTESQVKRILGSSYRLDTNTGSPTCAMASSATIPDVLLYLDHGIFQVTSVNPFPAKTGGPQSQAGIHVGMTETAVKQALGPSAVAQQPTSTTGTEYVLTTSTGMASALVQSGVVVSYEEGRHAGFEDGCV